MLFRSPETRAVAEVVQSMAAEAGFDLELRVTEVATALKEGEDGNFQLYMLAWSGRTDPDGNIFSFASCKGPLNYGRFCDAGMDGLLEKARTVTDINERKAIYQEVAQRWLAEGSVLYLYHRALLFAHSPRLDGFKVMPDGLIRVTDLKLK